MGGERSTAIVVAVAGLLGALPIVVGAPAGADPEPVVVIDELHYHPLADGQEFLELHNPGAAPVDVGGACFTAGISGCLPEPTSIEPSGHLVVAEDRAAYAAAFPAAPAPVLEYEGALSNGGERVTLSLDDDVLDTVAYDDAAPWPLSPDGAGPSLELTDALVDNDRPEPWAASDPAPTPGAVNSRAGQGPGPSLAALAHGPVAPDAPVVVAVDVDLASSVELEVTVGFEPAVRLPMADDGEHGDGTAGDGRFGVRVPGQPAGTLVRYRAVAGSATGTASLPEAGSPRPRLGYVVAVAEPPSSLPVVDWYVAPADYARLLENKDTNDYVPAVIASGGEVWDGAQVRVHGATRALPKLGFKVKMPAGHPLVAPALFEHPVDELVLDDDSRDAHGATAVLAMSVYADGNPLVPQIAKAHVRRNGAPFGLFTVVEEVDRMWRERVGLTDPGDQVFEPEGIVGTFVDEGSPRALEPRFEKVSPDDGDYDDLYELVRAIDAPPTTSRTERLRELFDVPALVEFLAVGAIVQHYDSTVHNFVLVRDGGSGRWRFVPWDLDFTLGQPLAAGQASPTGLRVPALHPYGPADLVSALRTDPLVAGQVLRRMRTLADRYLAGGELASRAAGWEALVAADVAADRRLWGLEHTFEQGRAQLAAYLADRRQELLVARRGPGEVPDAPTGIAPELSEVVHEAAAGPAGDFVELANPSSVETLDLSGWSLTGAAAAVLPPGTVLVPGGHLAVTTPVADGPGAVSLLDPTGAARASRSWDGSVVDPVGTPGEPATPVVRSGLVVEAAADQVEARTGDGSGVALTVAVANLGPLAASSVRLEVPGTTCGRDLGTIVVGASRTVRCTTLAGSIPDRTYVATATAAAGSAASTAEPVRVRAQTFRTNVSSDKLLAAPVLHDVLLRPDGRLGLTWTRPPSAVAGLRWTVATGVEPGRAVATVGQLLPPDGPAAFEATPVDRPVQVAIAGRNDAGTGPRTTPTPPITARASGSWPAADLDQLVALVYRAVDGRDPTSSELALWRAALASGTPAAQIVLDRLSRDAWVGDVEPVVRLYASSFGRAPDPGGLGYWLRRRASGASLASMASAFAATSEFRRTYGVLDDRGFVDRAYRNVLGRAPDPSGSAYWVGRLRAGWSRGRVLTSLSESSEGRRSLRPLVAPAVIGLGLLGTPLVDLVGASATAWLRSGGGEATVVDAVRSSAAFGRRAGELGVGSPP